MAGGDRVKLSPMLSRKPEASAVARRDAERQVMRVSAVARSALESAGQPLVAPIRGPLEVALGTDFSRVRIHADARAAAAADALGARAFAWGHDVAFARGEWAPESAPGRRLLAHELIHVAQAHGGAGITPPERLADEHDPAEREAESIAERFASVPERGHRGATRASPLHGAVPSGLPLRRREPATGHAKRTGLKRADAPGEIERAGPEAVNGSVLRFEVDTADLVPGQEEWLARLLGQAKGAKEIEVHGYASVEGPSGEYNYELGARRAVKIADLVVKYGATAMPRVVTHGPTKAYGPRFANRTVILVLRPTCITPKEDLDRAWKAAETTLQKSSALSKGFTFLGALTGRGRMGAPISNQYWFAKLYEMITYEELAAVRAGTFEHPEFLLRFIPIFYDMYYDSMQNYLRGDMGKVDVHWKTAFDVAAQGEVGSLADISASTRAAVIAHIVGDMSRALAATMRSFAAESCDHPASFARYRDDFFEKNRKIFEQVRLDFITEMAVQGGVIGFEPIDQTRQILGTAERLTGMGLDLDEVFKWRAKAWDEALQLIAANPAP
jgi:hypothetical protein